VVSKVGKAVIFDAGIPFFTLIEPKEIMGNHREPCVAMGNLTEHGC